MVRRWKVIQTVREKFSCRNCEAITQAPAPFHPIARGRAGPNLLATILEAKFAQHLPLNRQSESFAREGIALDVSTQADWVGAYPGLTGARLLRELRERGYRGGYTAVTDFLREVRPPPSPGFELRFETPPGEQAQVDFAQFQRVFTDEPDTPRVVWLFSMVLGFSRLIWGRFVAHQDLAAVLRCHVAAFEALGGVPREILYDRMKTAVTGEQDGEGIVYNRSLIDRARHYGFHPKACRPYRAQTTDEVE